MYQERDLIIYGNTGVCRIDAVSSPDNIRGADPTKLYYTLVPLYQPGVIYAPVDTTVFMRPVLSRKAAEELIERIPSIQEDDYQSRDQRLLSDHYRASLDSHKCEDLVGLIKSLYLKSKTALQGGKKLGQVAERYMKRAEDLLYGEFAAALGISRDEVVPYITQRVAGI